MTARAGGQRQRRAHNPPQQGLSLGERVVYVGEWSVEGRRGGGLGQDPDSDPNPKPYPYPYHYLYP